VDKLGERKMQEQSDWDAAEKESIKQKENFEKSKQDNKETKEFLNDMTQAFSCLLSELRNAGIETEQTDSVWAYVLQKHWEPQHKNKDIRKELGVGER
jgi:hypothetical protein